MRLHFVLSLLFFFLFSQVALAHAQQNSSGLVDSIEIIPASDTVIRSGSVIEFTARAYDINGNYLPLTTFAWSLSNPDDSIGFFAGADFTGTRVGTGKVKATAGGVSALSGIITVEHGDLDRMFLDLSPEQLTTHSLVSSAGIILYDSYDNFVTDYDISLHPVSLTADSGQFIPEYIDNNAYQVGGVVRLKPSGIKYAGNTVITDVYAESNGINSQAVTVSFNGYDILDVIDAEGTTVNEVYSGAQSTVFVIVQNNGNLTPESSPYITLTYRTDGSSNTETFTGHANGTIDTIPIMLPSYSLELTEDVLEVYLSADFLIGGASYTTVDTLELPVTIYQGTKFNVISNSVRPDSCYPGEEFNISFSVNYGTFSGNFDSTLLMVELAESPDGEGFAVIREDAPILGFIFINHLQYVQVDCLVPSELGLASGMYYLKFDYRLYVGNLIYTLENDFADSIYLLPEVALNYVDGTLEPKVAYADDETSFSFELNLSNSYSLNIFPELSSLNVIGQGFNVSTSLVSSNIQLLPGSNTLECEKVYIPEGQLENELHASVRIYYSVAANEPTFTFTSDFNGESVSVEELPSVKIISVDMVAPNVPKVNIGQEYQIVCRVANLSVSDVGPLTLSMVSDGGSSFDQEYILSNIPAGDTAEAYYDLAAGDDVNPSELFTVDIISNNINVLLPVDHVVLVQTERPASLKLIYMLLGSETSIFTYGEEFQLGVVLENDGDADVSTGHYVLTTGGVDFGYGDSVTGEISPDASLLSFKAPSFDTAVTFRFELTEIPRDLNDLQSATIDRTWFEFQVRVENLEADLMVESETVNPNLILPGRELRLFKLNLVNYGISQSTRIGLEEINLFFTDTEDNPVQASTFIIAGKTGFYEDDVKISHTTTGNSRAQFLFDDVIIEPGQVRTLYFEACFKATNEKSFKLHLDQNDIEALFVEGPHAGQSPSIVTGVEDDLVFSEIYTLKSKSLGSSFVIRDNPFDPDEAPAVFSYELNEPSAVELKIFTITGEEVYSEFFPEGSDKAGLGENFFEWNGCNNKGDIVRNGVYVVSIRILSSGETARIKVAVVR